MAYGRASIAPLALCLVLAGFTASAATDDQGRGNRAGPIYPSYGVHNPPSASPCVPPTCVYRRSRSQPADPQYPPFWQSRWTMYRVYNNYQRHMPPYDGRPPLPLRPGRDYEVSFGATYYDSTWRGRPGEGTGAMMEHYERRCLPIFPVPNNYTCSFISLGNTAYFVTYEQDRPAGMPPVCLFSPLNHAPRRDFIKHLPYALSDSQQLGAGAQAYSFWISAATGRPVQVGASPDQTRNQAIMFGYAFAPKNGRMEPSSFYFSGYPLAPANAPVVSQNYTDWAPTRPDPRRTWDQVAGLDPQSLPRCQLFDPPADTRSVGATAARAPTWAHIGRWRPRPTRR